MGESILFNKAILESILAPTDRVRTEYRDKKELGLYLYVSSRGVKTFYLYQKFEGNPLRLKIGRYPDFSVAAARDRARDLKGMLARGENPKKKDEKELWQTVTLGEVGEEYLSVRKLSVNTKRIYEGRLNLQLKPWKGLAMAEISKKRLTQLHQQIASISGDHMADLSMRLLSALFNFYIDRYDYTGVNPIKTLSANKLWKTSSADRRTGMIERRDLPKWFKAVMEHETKSERDYLLLLLFTGMRKTEASKLKWEDVDFKLGIFTVHETKNGKSLTLPMNDFLRELFESRYREQAGKWVFPSDADTSKPIRATNIAKKLSMASGVSFMLHDIRRTFLTIADELDLSTYVLKRLVNHSVSGDVTAGYIVSDISRLIEPSQKIADKILSIIEQSK